MVRADVDKDTFKQIFWDHWEAFKAWRPRFDTPYYEAVVHKMLDCGDPEKMGYVQYRCVYCGEKRRIAFSCKSSFCLSCARPRMTQWADFIGRRLFPGVTSSCRPSRNLRKKNWTGMLGWGRCRGVRTTNRM
jgi:hypothetical protein